jgi:hypothetical protein
MKPWDKEIDTLRLYDLARHHSLAFTRDGDTYAFDSFTAHGLSQALAFAEGFDRAIYAQQSFRALTVDDGRTLLFVPMTVLSASLRNDDDQRDLRRLRELIQQHGIILTQDDMPDFSAHTLSQALGFAEGFDRGVQHRTAARESKDA